MTRAFVEQRLAAYYDAEAAILTGQSYKMGSRELNRATLGEVRKGIQYWENQLAALKQGVNPNASRSIRVVPRDC